MPAPRTPTALLRSLSGEPEAPVAYGLTFAPPAVLQALAGRPAAVGALPVAAARLALDFVFVGPEDAEAYGPLRDVRCEPVAVVNGPLAQTLDCVGWRDGLLATAQDPASLRTLLAEAHEESLAAARAAVRHGAAAVAIAEDLAGADGPLVAPDFAFAEVFPRLKALVSVAAEDGVPCLLHTDGDSRAFVSAAGRAGFAGIHGGGGLAGGRHDRLVDAVRREGMAFLGGIPTTDLEGGLMRAVTAGSRAGVLARRGGVLLCDDGGLATEAEAQAFVTALAAARDAAERSTGTR